MNTENGVIKDARSLGTQNANLRSSAYVCNVWSHHLSTNFSFSYFTGEDFQSRLL